MEDLNFTSTNGLLILRPLFFLKTCQGIMILASPYILPFISEGEYLREEAVVDDSVVAVHNVPSLNIQKV